MLCITKSRQIKNEVGTGALIKESYWRWEISGIACCTYPGSIYYPLPFSVHNCKFVMEVSKKVIGPRFLFYLLLSVSISLIIIIIIIIIISVLKVRGQLLASCQESKCIM